MKCPHWGFRLLWGVCFLRAKTKMGFAFTLGVRSSFEIDSSPVSVPSIRGDKHGYSHINYTSKDIIMNRLAISSARLLFRANTRRQFADKATTTTTTTAVTTPGAAAPNAVSTKVVKEVPREVPVSNDKSSFSGADRFFFLLVGCHALRGLGFFFFFLSAFCSLPLINSLLCVAERFGSFLAGAGLGFGACYYIIYEELKDSNERFAAQLKALAKQ
jgi:hypothetical protein